MILCIIQHFSFYQYPLRGWWHVTLYSAPLIINNALNWLKHNILCREKARNVKANSLKSEQQANFYSVGPCIYYSIFLHSYDHVHYNLMFTTISGSLMCPRCQGQWSCGLLSTVLSLQDYLKTTSKQVLHSPFSTSIARTRS